MLTEYKNTPAYAGDMDQSDPLKHIREEYHIPSHKGKTAIYFTGNSLGLQPKNARSFIDQELMKWAEMGVDGHFHGEKPWFTYHEQFKKGLMALTGARENEVVPMNNLTTNLHLMMISFYQPTKERFKIVMEGGAFPSDQYAVESQVRLHGLNPEETIIEVTPREGEFILREEDIINCIEEHGNSVYLVLFSGIHYFTGQKFNSKNINIAAHKVGAYAGWDLAHAIGNVPLSLHDDDSDFAVWCTYKYLNSGPGSVGGAFIHEKYANKPELLRLAGWWGYDQNDRFLMRKGFKPMEGADGWQLSNFNILGSAAHLAALKLFQQVGMKKLVEKSRLLTGYLFFLLNDIDSTQKYFKIITPVAPEERGCQLSLFFPLHGRKIFNYLSDNHIVTDWREDQSGNNPQHAGVIRIAPTPMYNTFVDIYRFSNLLKKAFHEIE